MKKGVGSGSGSISQRYGSEDPNPHQNVTDPPHWLQWVLRYLKVEILCHSSEWAIKAQSELTQLHGWPPLLCGERPFESNLSVTGLAFKAQGLAFKARELAVKAQGGPPLSKKEMLRIKESRVTKAKWIFFLCLIWVHCSPSYLVNLTYSDCFDTVPL